jgi:hypothetical protein
MALSSRITWHRGAVPLTAFSFAGDGSSGFSSAAFGKIGDEYVKAVYRFAEAHRIPIVHFKKGQNKEEVALEAAANEGKDRVVLSEWHKRRRQCGDPGRGKDRRKHAIRT